MTELTPRDDIKKRISEILKRVDRLIRAGEIDQAMREIIQAKEIDPRNVYIFAYAERLSYLKQEHDHHQEEEQTRKQAEEAARKRDEELRRRREDEEERQQTLLEQRKREQDERIKGKLKEKERAEQAVSLEQLEEQLRAAEEELQQQEQAEEKSKEGLAAHADALARYKGELVRVWQDGATTPIEESDLKELRWNLGISIEEHSKLTKEAQRECYLNAFKEAWSSGSITPERANELSDLRKRFKISPEEFDSIEAEILWRIRTSLQPPTVVLVDDDVRLLEVVTQTLQEAGYNMKAFSTSDDAYRYLKENTPDLIISDINLETSTMGGFTFLEKTREIDRLQEIPFIFLSGLTDEVLIRTGKELGVDDYMTKPFSDETLLATIKGKLKRFRKLREARQKKKG
ncbi:MAG: response regulator [Ignavibacteria bacterium]|nr:response regulator [Ignavibacteria bacterium]